jgi:glycosyltransferase involved in cell wall biosynthesis
MLENYHIICFAPSDWWAMNPSCTIHIVKRLANKNKVLYVNPFSSDLLGEKKGVSKRILRKIKSIAKWVRNPQRNLYVFSPLFLPLQGNKIIDSFNNALLKAQLTSVCQLLGIKHPILWVENLRAADLLDWFDSQSIIYHISDLFTKSRYIANKQKLQQREEQITAKSDLVICVSKSLYNIKCTQHRNVHYLPHGVDFELFREAVQKEATLPEIAHIRKPIAGYYGTMTANNDIELLSWCTHQLPEVSFVLAGQITSGDYSQLHHLPNVHLLGKLPYDKIPSLCASFDVCMLQWKMTDWIQCCNPLKLMEYMASGKPIVSVPIKEAMQFSDLISITHNKEDFAKAIRWELQNDTRERSRKRIEIAKSHSWDKHAEKISELIETAIAAKQNDAIYSSTSQKGSSAIN